MEYINQIMYVIKKLLKIKTNFVAKYPLSSLSNKMEKIQIISRADVEKLLKEN